MRRADAPPPGWYPAPTGATRLWWWDGSDWTDHRRTPPAQLDLHLELEDARAGDARAAAPPDRPELPTATQLRSRAAASRRSEQDVVDAVAEARRVARHEVETAMREATSQLDAARDRYLPRVEAYVGRLKRWARIAAVVVVAFVVLSTWAQATFQTSLLEWLGERIDATTAGDDAAATTPTTVGSAVPAPGR